LPTRLRGDPGRLRQILTNILGNALKFTEKGEVIVRVSLECQTETHARIHFQVEDSGIGISPEAQRSLFQAFSQADGSTTRKYGGTGLGLAIAKQLTALMGGQIGVLSEPGTGSTFWFTAELEKQPGEAAHSRLSDHRLFEASILAVDDNSTNRRILQDLLRGWKMRVENAKSGDEALRILQAAVEAGRPYQVALLDVEMPEMDGWTLARAIRRQPALAGIQLIVLTAFGQSFSPEELILQGVEAYISKPVKQLRLFDCLVNAMGRVGTKNSATLQPAISLSPATSLRPSQPLDTMRILLAEDNSTNQKVALGQLRKLGYRADAVESGLLVLEILQRLPYDVILMDCQMQGMDGYEATEAIRRQEQSLVLPSHWEAPIYIIAMTAHAMQGDSEKCFAAGMDDYLSKPVREPALQAALERGKMAAERRATAFEKSAFPSPKSTAT